MDRFWRYSVAGGGGGLGLSNSSPFNTNDGAEMHEYMIV
jgi:hypothetical protein